jgi:hypothetical protein
MIRACSFAGHRSMIVALAVLAGTACNETEDLAAPADVPSTTTADAAPDDSLTAMDSLNSTLASVSFSGLPYGPIGLWATLTTFEMGPEPFTLSQEMVSSSSIVARINNARNKRQRLVLAMTGGNASDYKTNGKFDLAKWKRRMNSFNTSTIRNAVAGGVSDGTVVGNTMMDEPETVKWGGNVSKSVLDNMAVYTKGIFPSLPVGVNVGPPGYRWRASERFHKLDWVRYQYNWLVTSGNIGTWRSAVLDQARKDGVTPAFSLNVLDGGVKDTQGSWDCAWTNRGTFNRNCWMSPDQVRTYGKAIGPSGCFMLMWTYTDAFMSKSANRDAFKDVASTMATKSRRSCRRP